MNFEEFLLESASEEAKSRGLKSAGGAYWKDSTGKVVAQTKQGKLVPAHHKEIELQLHKHVSFDQKDSVVNITGTGTKKTLTMATGSEKRAKEHADRFKSHGLKNVQVQKHPDFSDRWKITGEHHYDESEVGKSVKVNPSKVKSKLESLGVNTSNIQTTAHPKQANKHIVTINFRGSPPSDKDHDKIVKALKKAGASEAGLEIKNTFRGEGYSITGVFDTDKLT